MKIGIACTTYNRPAHIEMWTKYASLYSPHDAMFHIANDTVDRRGIAYRKTECIRELYNEDCDYYFIFDDDTFPIKVGWCDFFINALIASGSNHFCYMVDSAATKVVETKRFIGPPMKEDMVAGCTSVGEYYINRFDNCNGCLLVMTKKAVETVGGFNPNYGFYGMEHADYTNRIYSAGLNPMGAYLCPVGASEYIYACDLDNSLPDIQKKLKHKSSMKPREALYHAAKSLEVYKQPSEIYYPL